MLVNVTKINLSLCTSHRLGALDLHTAVSYLDSADKEEQALGAAYIQHECYNHKESKKLVRAGEFYNQPNEVVRGI